MRFSLTAAAVGVVLAGSSALADGVVMGSWGGPHEFLTKRTGGPDEAPVDPVIPDQRALIVHRDGRETLVIETAFQGHGTEFAWVVPTPSVPKIAEASTDLFPRLVEAARPDLTSEVPDLRIAGLVVIGGLVLARHGGRRGARVATTLVAGAAAVAFLADVASPDSGSHVRGVLTLGAPAGMQVRVPMTPAEEPVAVRQREVVGAFDTVTLSARDPHALVDWLVGHGYSVPAALAPVAAEYVREGWVFNAMRLRRDADGRDAVRIHPVAFTFEAAEPVYPMRLTGVTGKPVLVDLFVAGARRADADGFVVDRCARIDTDARHDDDLEHVMLADDAVKPFVEGSAVLTRMDRTFAPEAMKSDAPIRWTDYETSQRSVFSEKAAAALAWNAGAVLAIAAFVGLASAASCANGRRRPSSVRKIAATILILIVALDAGLAIAAFVPTVKTQPRSEAAHQVRR